MSDFKRSDREPKVLVREPMKIQTSADPPMNHQANVYLMEQRITELERQNALLRAVAGMALRSLNDSDSILVSWPGIVDMRIALQAAIDGGALDKDGEK